MTSKNWTYCVLAGILICLLSVSASGVEPLRVKTELPPPEQSTPTATTPSEGTLSIALASPKETPSTSTKAKPPTVITPPDMMPSTAPALTDIAPADALLVLQIKDVAEMLSLIENSNAWQQLLEAPMWEMLWAAVEMETGAKNLHHLIRPSVSILSHLLGQEVLLVVPKFKGIVEISPTLMIELNRSDDLGEILSSAIHVLMSNIPEVKTREYNGYSYLTALLDANIPLSCGIIDNYLIASLGETTIRKIIDLHQGKSEASLAKDPNFSQVIERLRATSADKVTDYQTLFYVDLTVLPEFAEMVYPMAREEVDENLRPLMDGAVKWLDLVESVITVSNLTEDGILSQSYVELNPDATASNFHAMLQAEPTRHDSIKFAPADTTSYSAFNLVDLPKLWQMAMNAVKSMPPEISGELLGGLEQIQTQLGIDIEEDLFSWMGNEIALIRIGGLNMFPTENPSDAISGILLSIQTTDSAKATESLGRLTDLVADLVAMTLGGIMGAQLEWDMVNYAGAQIRTTTLPESSLRPSYVVTEQYVLISSELSDLKTALDCARGTAKNLLTDPQFKELRGIAPDRVNYISYSNPARALGQIMDSLTEQMPALLEEDLSEMEFELIQSVLPPAADFVREITKTLVGQIEYIVKDGEGLRSYSLLKVRDSAENFEFADPPEAKIARSLLIARGYIENGMPNRAHTYLNRVLESDPGHPDAVMMKISLLEEEGDQKRADWYRSQLGFANEGAWYIIGPFPNPDGDGFNMLYPPELDIDLEESYEVEGVAISWKKRWDGNRNDGFVNFYEMFDDPEWKVGYAWTTITVEEAREVELRIGSDDDVKVWVNGIDALINQIGRSAEPDQDRVHVSLHQGENRILVKVCNREQDWGFYLRFTDENRRPIKGLTYGK